MSKPNCKCGHNKTKHANTKYTTKKGENKTYTACRNKDCNCKAYQPIQNTTPPELPEVLTQGETKGQE
jgi:hypothetical protein